MPKILIITGVTATGKTDLGLYFAKKYGGEIVSADSRHVYEGMDIGTGKDIPASAGLKIKLKTGSNLKVGIRRKDGIPIWLVDIVPPDFQFNLGDFRRLADKVIDDIVVRNKTPIIVGGTGLYVKSLVLPMSNIFVPPNKLLRQKLLDTGVSGLQDILKEKDLDKWESLNRSDRFNPRRLVRAIEIAENTHFETKSSNYPKELGDWYMVFLVAKKEFLAEKIDRRVDLRLKEGIITEIERLLEKGYGFELPSFSATPYRLFKPYFTGNRTKELLKKTVADWKLRERQLAQNQLTWIQKFRGLLPKTKTCAIDVSEKGYLHTLEKQLDIWYTSK